eukprot:2312038-Pyramimonas_sp.AAC.1
MDRRRSQRPVILTPSDESASKVNMDEVHVAEARAVTRTVVTLVRRILVSIRRHQFFPTKGDSSYGCSFSRPLVPLLQDPPRFMYWIYYRCRPPAQTCTGMLDVLLRPPEHSFCNCNRLNTFSKDAISLQFFVQTSNNNRCQLSGRCNLLESRYSREPLRQSRDIPTSNIKALLRSGISIRNRSCTVSQPYACCRTPVSYTAACCLRASRRNAGAIKPLPTSCLHGGVCHRLRNARMQR